MEQIIKKPSWWNKRSTLEKSLLLIFSLAVLTAALLAIGILLLILKFIKTTGPVPTSTSICVTPACLEASAQIIKRMNNSVDPCENFYQFACGNFENIVEIPESEERISTLSMIGNKVKEQLRRVLEEPIHSEEAKSLTLGKTFYKTCLDEDVIEEQGLEPIKKLMRELGGWPVLEGDSWNENDFDWKELNYKLRNKGISFAQLVNFYVSEDAKNQSQKVFHLFQASMDLPKEYVDRDVDDPISKGYYQFMIDMTTALGANETVAEKEMMDVFIFQRNLSEISLSAIEMRNASTLYNNMTVEELQKLHPYIQWLEYFNNILSPVLQINKTEIIINQTPPFFMKLENLLNNTPNRTIANYIFWCVLRSTMNTLPKNMYKLELKFLKTAGGISKPIPRWKKCIQTTKNYFDLVIGSLYVRKYFNRQSKKKIVEIVDNIKDTFKNDLKKTEWMDSKTKNSALEKLKVMFQHVAYPDELLDDEKLDEHYENLHVDENSFFLSVLSLNKFWADYTYRKLREPVNKTDWIAHGNAAEPGAFYSFGQNSFILSAGILQGSFFSSQHPNYMNYGAIGFTIGHEITHGFDNEGRQYNKEGEVHDWWGPDTEKAFLEKAKCIVDQYSNYRVTEIDQNINGELTQGENIADNGGLKQSYFAYNKWLQQNKNQEQQLPGLLYTPLQMFWISMASNWCSLDRPEILKLLLQKDEHAPYPFRIIGSISNRPEFTQDFNCPIGSKMNPKNRCQIW